MTSDRELVGRFMEQQKALTVPCFQCGHPLGEHNRDGEHGCLHDDYRRWGWLLSRSHRCPCSSFRL